MKTRIIKIPMKKVLAVLLSASPAIAMLFWEETRLGLFFITLVLLMLGIFMGAGWLIQWLWRDK